MTAASDAAHPCRRWGLLIGVLLLAACADDPTSTTPVCGTAPALVPGRPVEEVLDEGDARFAGAHIDYYSLDLSDSAAVDVQLVSTELDPLLFLFHADGSLRVQVFDSAGSPEGQLESAAFTRRLAPGCHLIGASSWENRATGAYTLRADTRPPGNGEPPAEVLGLIR